MTATTGEPQDSGEGPAAGGADAGPAAATPSSAALERADLRWYLDVEDTAERLARHVGLEEPGVRDLVAAYEETRALLRGAPVPFARPWTTDGASALPDPLPTLTGDPQADHAILAELVDTRLGSALPLDEVERAMALSALEPRPTRSSPGGSIHEAAPLTLPTAAGVPAPPAPGGAPAPAPPGAHRPVGAPSTGGGGSRTVVVVSVGLFLLVAALVVSQAVSSSGLLPSLSDPFDPFSGEFDDWESAPPGEDPDPDGTWSSPIVAALEPHLDEVDQRAERCQPWDDGPRRDEFRVTIEGGLVARADADVVRDALEGVGFEWFADGEELGSWFGSQWEGDRWRGSGRFIDRTDRDRVEVVVESQCGLLGR